MKTDPPRTAKNNHPGISYPVIDADGHVMEKDGELHDFLEGRHRGLPRFETYSYFPSLDGWHRGSSVPGKDADVPASRWVEFLDELGIDVSVLYPTAWLALGHNQHPVWSCAVGHA